MLNEEQSILATEVQAESSDQGAILSSSTANGEDENSMQSLLNHSGPGGGAMRTLQRGDVIEGTVVRVDRDEIMVDIGFKTEGVIPAQDVANERPDARIEVGDKVMVYVVNPETKEGNGDALAGQGAPGT